MQSFFSGCAESLEKHRLEQAGSVVFKRVFFFSISENRQPVILKEPASSILLRINLAKQLTRIS